MAKLVFGMNQSLDGYVDHLAFAPSPALFRHLLVIRPDVTGDSFRAIGSVPVIIGSVLLLRCVRDFYVAGKGTLAPWSPPRNLVVIGLYRFSRNPMYIAVTLILSGWALVFHSRALWIYTLAVSLTFHLRVIFSEEPWFACTHAEAWPRYKARVPRSLF